jgi:hypothetical protein
MKPGQRLSDLQKYILVTALENHVARNEPACDLRYQDVLTGYSQSRIRDRPAAEEFLSKAVALLVARGLVVRVRGGLNLTEAGNLTARPPGERPSLEGPAKKTRSAEEVAEARRGRRG